MATEAPPASFLESLATTEEAPATLTPAPPRQPARSKTAEEKQLDQLRAREDRILEKSMALVESALHGGDVDDGQRDLPEEWIREFGMDGAGRLMRIAQDARRSPKEHPVYLDLAKSVMIGIVKARAVQPREVASLTFNFTLAAPPKAYPIIDIEPDEK